jgi:glycosyltransferase involved in cell wall biosynthesis
VTHTSAVKQIKVCLVAISLSEGGAERSTALLSKMLSNEGFDVHLVIIKNKIDYEYSGSLFALGNEKKPLGFVSTLIRLIKFRSYLKKNTFDIIIDNRTRSTSFKEMVYSYFLYSGIKRLYVIRSSSLSMYFPKSKWVVNKQSRNVAKYIGVSKAIVKMVLKEYSIKNCISIYNPIDLIQVRSLSEENIDDKYGKYIIAMGRLDEAVKNYSLLLESYQNSKLPENNIGLRILGKGPDERLIREKIDQMGLQDLVQVIPFTSNPFPWLKNAQFTVLTSRFEGFPRVLIESLAVATPVLSVDCETGPAEIIQNGINGLLVLNNNSIELANAMNNLIFDTDLYQTLKSNAIESVSHLDIDRISKEWKQIIKDELL